MHISDSVALNMPGPGDGHPITATLARLKWIGDHDLNMFDFIEQGVVSPRDTDFTARLAAHLAAQRTRRTDPEQEIVLVERQLSATDRGVTPEAIGRLGDVILRKLRSDNAILRQGYAHRFVDRAVVAPRHDNHQRANQAGRKSP